MYHLANLPRRLRLGVALLLVLLGGTLALAQPAGLTLDWWTGDGGGGTSSGGAYHLSGTIGQADAGRLAGGAYTVQGGFWAGGSLPSRYALALPLVQR